MTRVIEKICDEAAIKEEALQTGVRPREESHARAKISYQLSGELGIPSVEMARHLGVCTSAIAKAIQKLESQEKSNRFQQRPSLLTRFVYDMEDVLFEYDGDNTLTARYIHGPGIDDPIGMERGEKATSTTPMDWGASPKSPTPQGRSFQATNMMPSVTSPPKPEA